MKKFGLIGKTLSHSFSKNYFSSRFAELGLTDSCTYENFELNVIGDIKNLIENDHQLVGLNITIPYKEQIIAFLDELNPSAKEIGAVNTVRIERNSDGSVRNLTGFNTDVIGFSNSLLPLLMPNHTAALILGTGGASKAVEWALKKMNIAYLKISRSEGVNSLNYTEVNRDLLEKYPVIINTTPLGTFPNNDTAPPIPYEYLSVRNLLFDLVYNPAETKFMKLGKMKGATVCNGLDMLKIQAEEAWKIWNVF